MKKTAIRLAVRQLKRERRNIKNHIEVIDHWVGTLRTARRILQAQKRSWWRKAA